MAHPYTIHDQTFYFKTYRVAFDVRNNLNDQGVLDIRILEYPQGYLLQRQNGKVWGYPKEFGVPGWR